MKTSTPTAGSISGALRRLGFNPLAAETPWSYEGIRVKNNRGGARVNVDIDAPSRAARISRDAEDALTGKGYTVNRVSETVFVVTGKG